MESADELLGLTAGVSGSARGIDEPSASMRAYVVESAELIGRRANDQDRVIEDVIGEIIADVGDLLDAAADLLPHLAPQPVTLVPRVLLGSVGLDSDRHRLGQLLRGLYHLSDVGNFVHDILPGTGAAGAPASIGLIQGYLVRTINQHIGQNFEYNNE